MNVRPLCGGSRLAPRNGSEVRHMKKPVAAAIVAGSLFAGVGVGAAFFGPGLASAQSSSSDTSSSSSASPTDPNASAAPTSNEDPTHEASETPEQEAAETNGTAHHGRHGHGPGD